MSNINALAVVEENKLRCIASPDEVRGILEELGDIENLGQALMGRIKIGSGGMRAFSIYEPGDDEPEVQKTIEGVIVLSHKCNAYWSRPMEEAGEDKAPDCSSMNGEEGIERDTGAIMPCAKCPRNKFGSDPRGGNGKACKNMQRLYILRENDLFPMILTLPATSLKAFDNYRVAVGLKMKRVNGMITRISLKPAKNATGIDYSTATFEAVGLLSVTDAEKMRAYSDGIGLSAMKAGITADDFAAESKDNFHQVNDASLPSDWKDNPVPSERAEQTTSFAPVDDDELPPEAR